MSDKVLSQDEISALLAAVGKDEPKPASEAKSATAGDRPAKKRLSASDQEGYLFPMARAEELSKELEAALLLIFDAFSHKGSATFSHTFRTQVGFKLHDVEQIFYGDFIESLPEPSSIWYLEVKPHSQHVAVCLEPNLVNHIVSVMLGGAPADVRGRNLITDLEQNIVEAAVTVFCRELRHAWSRVSEVEIEIDNRETRPRLLRIYPANEVMVVLGMAMKIGQAEGTLYWGLPTNLLKTLQDQVSHQRQVESREKLSENVNRVRELAMFFQTRVEARLGMTPVSMVELLSLKAGDILRLEHLVGDPADVLINGSKAFAGEIVVARDRRTVRVAG